ncbi:hypothetical protein ACJRO7_017813 [Eucalyptus globulus]|uniref:Pectinesterase inhibitor domain-containing protein n=1 Tax=Eucalyptus globulus TaxID=34317 RepID=A0ABD3KSN5_EUCGL
MATSHALLLFCNLPFFALLAWIIIESSVVTAADPRLVDWICYRTTPVYKIFKDVLDSDPCTPGASAAHRNASRTREHITSLLSNLTDPVHQLLERYRRDYATVITYVRLIYFPSTLLNQAKDCESAFEGAKSPLTDSNTDLEGFSAIGVSIAQELTV